MMSTNGPHRTANMGGGGRSRRGGEVTRDYGVILYADCAQRVGAWGKRLSGKLGQVEGARGPGAMLEHKPASAPA